MGFCKIYLNDKEERVLGFQIEENKVGYTHYTLPPLNNIKLETLVSILNAEAHKWAINKVLRAVAKGIKGKTVEFSGTEDDIFAQLKGLMEDGWSLDVFS